MNLNSASLSVPWRVLRRRLPLLVCLLGLAVVAGCGDEGSPADDGPTVVATTGFAADLVRQVAGEDAEVVQLVPSSANPHSYSASAKDRATLGGADLVVAFGRGYEEGLPLDEVSGPRLEIANEVGSLRRFEEGELPEEEHAGEEERGPGARDPHVWLDPVRMAAAVPRIAEALARADEAKAATYRERGQRVARDLRALDGELRATMAPIPAERRKLVTSHESMGYFAERYRFEFVGAPFGLSPEAEASASGIAEVIAQIRREQVPAVFAQAGDDPKVMRRIAAETGVRVFDDLLVENPGPQGDTYAAAMRHNARVLVEALGQ